MSAWVLLIVLFRGPTGPVFTQVEGFKDEATCEAAADRVKFHLTPVYSAHLSAICLSRNEPKGVPPW